MAKVDKTSDTNNDIQAEHIDHAREVVSQAGAKHQWTQRGVEISCPGDRTHYAHGFIVPARYVLRAVSPDGDLEFENLVTKERSVGIPVE